MGRYRWLGAGDELIDSGGTGIAPFAPCSNAWESLTGGDFQEWELGLQMNIPLGFRRAMTCAYMPEGSVFNGEQNILSDEQVSRLKVGDPLNDNQQNPLIFLR